MRIGVDASCWMNKRGYGRYTRELLRAMLTLDQENEYWFFMDSETARESEDLPDPKRAKRIIAQTSQAATRAASASGRRSLQDMWNMARAVRQHGRELELFYFPADYTFFPLSTKAKVVLTCHDTTAERFPSLIFPNKRAQLFWKLKVRWALRRADLVATVSEAAKQDLMDQFGLSDAMVKVVPDGVDPAFRPLADLKATDRVLSAHGLTSDQRFILYVGGISPHKNLATLLDAYASLVKDSKDQNVKLVLIGDFEKDVFFSSYPAVRDRVEALSLSGKVVFTGFVSDTDLPHFYNAGEVLVLPSFAEGFGLPALEAMACGTPVAVSNAGALPEVVGDAGLFFDPYSAREIRQRLQELIENEELRRELGQRGLRRARNFSWECSARRALDTFNGLVSRA
ncbi:MAG: glycosyltransferase family 4 protein [Pyrinomonadaceae bacterium]|nr:glycosyltransferase family 4 protein [Pyrinomonadaceae bacterium]